MLRDASDSGNDGGILDGYTLEDIDYDTLKSYRIEYELRNPEHVWNGLDNTEFLRNLGAYSRERNTGREGLTTILNAWGEENWRKPDLSENPELHQVDLKLWMISLMPVECTEYLYRLFGMSYQHLSSSEQIVLATA